MEKRINLISVSKGDIKNSIGWNSLVKMGDDVKIDVVENNTEPLSVVYNRFLTPERKDYIVVFVHDDLFISDYGNFGEKCREACKLYDVFGVAGGFGGLEITPEKPALWHLISKKHAGFAGHYDEASIDKRNPYTKCWVTTFGLSPQPVTLIDGAFLGVNVERVLDSGVRFDEECPAKFHFYDLLFCINAKRKGLKLGVFPFNTFHQSPGLKSFTDEFVKGDQYFKQYCSTIQP